LSIFENSQSFNSLMRLRLLEVSMAEILQVQCYKCQTVYEVAVEMAGQLVECAICSSIFAVPAPIPGRETEIHATYPYVQFTETPAEDPPVAEQKYSQEAPAERHEEVPAAAGQPERNPALETSDEKITPAPAVTNTVKLSRSNIGMMPKVDDAFGFGTVNNIVPKYTGKENPLETATAKPARSTQTNKPKPAQSAPVSPAPARKWWQFWRWFSKK
jgi:ribosomal protein S27E